MKLATETAIRVPDALSTQRRVGRRHQGAGKVVAIIGAGFSGTMAAIHLRHALPPDWIVVLFDRTGRFARGPAYAASNAPHLLNVRSVNMSALPDDPGHFERWLGGQSARWPGEIQVTEAGTFASRRELSAAAVVIASGTLLPASHATASCSTIPGRPGRPPACGPASPC